MPATKPALVKDMKKDRLDVNRLDKKIQSIARLKDSKLEPLLMIEDVATLCSVHDKTIQLWVKQGKIPAIRVGRSVRFIWDDVVKAMKKNHTIKP